MSDSLAPTMIEAMKRFAEWHAMVKRHDLTFEWSDDPDAYFAGRRSMQKLIDFSIEHRFDRAVCRRLWRRHVATRIPDLDLRNKLFAPGDSFGVVK